jgi:peptidoglycan/xylan/chitin deacetylase (PgdA/CDA1 family)
VRVAPRLLAATLAISTLVVAGGLAASPAAGAPTGDGRGATHVHETPQPPAGPGEAVVSLTFDDGPHPTYTPPILDVLGRYGVKATFFQLGREAERHPDLVRRVVAEGHVVANHTWDHENLRTLDDARFGEQIDRTNQVLESLSGQRQVCVRPPYGKSDPGVTQRLAARGMTSVVWTADSRDFEKPGADAIVASALEGLQPGGVILLHDGGGGREQTIEALPRIIEGIRAAGYRIAPICAPDPHLPFGGLGAVTAGHGTVRAEGWATDPDQAEPIDVHLYLDGALAGSVRADGEGDPGPRFTGHLPVGPGRHEVCAYAINAGTGAGGVNPKVGCIATEVGPLTAFDDLRPLVARVRFAQLVAQAEVVERVVLVHDARSLPWRLDPESEIASALLARSSG